MAGSDITAEEISVFVSRWNNTMVAWNLNIYSPTSDYPDIIDNNLLKVYVQKTDSVENYAISRGYASMGEMYIQAMADVRDQMESGRKAVCASVTIQIDQKVVMTVKHLKARLLFITGMRQWQWKGSN